MSPFSKLKAEYGHDFTKHLYLAVPKSWWDENGASPTTHVGACKTAGLVMVMLKLELAGADE